MNKVVKPNMIDSSDSDESNDDNSNNVLTKMREYQKFNHPIGMTIESAEEVVENKKIEDINNPDIHDAEFLALLSRASEVVEDHVNNKINNKSEDNI